MSEARTSQLKPRQSTEINPGPASNENKIILPKNTTAHLAEINSEEGSIAYDTDLQSIVINNGSSFAPVSGSGGVSDLNGLTGNVVLSAGTNITITPVGNTLTIDAASGGSSVGGVNEIQMSDGAGGFLSEAGITASSGAMQVTGGSSQNSFRSFSSASVNELFFGRSAALGECFVVSHWPDAVPEYTDLHLYSGPSNHLTLDVNGKVGMNSNAFLFDNSVNSVRLSNGGAINASGAASFAHGTESAFGGSSITASGVGSEAAGQIFNGANKSIEANGGGSKAFGEMISQGGTHIIANGPGSIAHGKNECFNATMVANGSGAIAGGSMGGGFPGSIAANGDGSMARGATSQTGAITAAGEGSIASGRADSGAALNANSTGSLSLGHASGSGLVINSLGIGSIASGLADNFSISANSNGSISVGLASVEQLYVINPGAQAFGDSNRVAANVASAFGIGHTNNSYGAMLIGRYGELTETPGSWVASETAFAVGGGTAIGAEANIYRITKAGHVCTNSAQATVDPGGDSGTGAVAIANASATDKAGRVRVTTGTGATSGQLIEITFATPYANAPSIVVTPESANARGLTAIGVESVGPSGFVIAAASVADATEYDFNYQVIGLE